MYSELRTETLSQLIFIRILPKKQVHNNVVQSWLLTYFL